MKKKPPLGSIAQLKEACKKRLDLLRNNLVRFGKAIFWGQSKSLKKAVIHWLLVVGVVVAGLYFREWLVDQDFFEKPSYIAFRWLQGTNPFQRQPHADNTVLIVIGDEEYWKGDLAARVPIKRSYLAQLLRVLDSADPAVIALDFDLRAQTMDGSLIEHEDYKSETIELLDAVKAVARNRAVVLPRTVRFDDASKESYVLDRVIFDDFDFGDSKVRTGYITLPYDIRRIPLSWVMKDGTEVDSFAGAIVQAANERARKRVSGEFPYGSYVKPEDFEQFSAEQTLTKDPSVVEELRHKIVIVGQNRHSQAFGQGELTDVYPTSVGTIPGVFLHANYVEALLSSQVYTPVPGFVDTVIESALAVGVSLIFWLGARKRIVVLLVSTIVIGSYVLWQNLGIFFDIYIPTFFIFLHAFCEQIWEWRADARNYSRLSKVQTPAVASVHAIARTNPHTPFITRLSERRRRPRR